jgi:Tfp pilus assembly protein PilN
MIKVNLLKDQTTHAHKSFAKPTVSRMGLTLCAIFVLVAVGMGAWTMSVQHQIQTGIEKRDVLRVEEARLQTLQNEIDKYEKLKQLRQNRIDIIENLKENQKGPVLLLNVVIQSIPRDGVLWLTSVSQKSDTINILGFTQHPEVIPDFMSNLSASGIFQSVDLELIERQKEATQFSLICISKTKPQAE